MATTFNTFLVAALLVANIGSHAQSVGQAPAQSPAIVTLAEEFSHQGLGVIYKVKKNAALLYLGTRHTFDPEDDQIEAIEKFLAEFRPTLVVVEGGDWPLAADKTQAIRKYGEFGFARFLAGQKNIRWKSFEPTLDDEMAEVLKQHTPTEAKLYYALRLVPQWVATDSGNIEQNMAAFLAPEKSLANFGKHFPPDTKPRTVAELAEVCQTQFPELKDWRKIGFQYTEIGKKTSVFHKVQKTSSAMRNRAIEAEIFAAMAKGERVMVLAGINHLGGTVSSVLSKLAVGE
jgi:hypothetical protein